MQRICGDNADLFEYQNIQEVSPLQKDRAKMPKAERPHFGGGGLLSMLSGLIKF